MCSSLSTLEAISQRFDADDLVFLAHNPFLRYRVHNEVLFGHHIYSRIKKQNPSHRIERQSGGAIIIHGNTQAEHLFLYPCWKEIGTDVRGDVCDDVSFAINQLDNKTCQHIYLLFPKSEHFRKHISIKIPHLEDAGIAYTLKLVPYKIN